MSKPAQLVSSSFHRLRFECLEPRLPLSANPALPLPPVEVEESPPSIAELNDHPSVQIAKVDFRSVVVDSASQVVTEFEPGRDYVLRIHGAIDIPIANNGVQQLFMEIELNEGVELQSADRVKYTVSGRTGASPDLQMRTVIADVDSQAFADSELLAEIPFSITGNGADAVFSATPYFLVGQSPNFFAIADKATGEGNANSAGLVPVFEFSRNLADTGISIRGAAPSAPPPFADVIDTISTTVNTVDSADVVPVASIPEGVSEKLAPAEVAMDDEGTLSAVPVNPFPDKPTVETLDPRVVLPDPVDAVPLLADSPNNDLGIRPKVPRAAAHAVAVDPLVADAPGTTRANSAVDLHDAQWRDLHHFVEDFFDRYDGQYGDEIEGNQKREKTLELLLLEFDHEVETVQDAAMSIQWSRRTPKLRSLRSAMTTDEDDAVSDAVLFDELRLDWDEIMESRMEMFESKRSMFRMQARIFSTAAKTDDNDVAASRDDYRSVDIGQVLRAPACKDHPLPLDGSQERHQAIAEFVWVKDLPGEQRIATIWDETSRTQTVSPLQEQSSDSQVIQQAVPAESTDG